MEIEVRKIQKVGTGSLVVTLPKEWAKKLGFEPGAQVLLIDEGDSIRIRPIKETKDTTIKLDLTKVPSNLAASAPLCVYLSAINEAEIYFPAKDVLEEAKSRSLYLMGLQIFDVPEENSAKVEVLLDSSKVDIPRLLKTLTVNVRESARLLNRALHGEVEGVKERVEITRTQFLRTHYIVLRHLAARYSERGGIENYYVILSTSYAGFAIDLLQELVLTSLNLIKEPLPLSDLQKLRKIIESVESSGDLLFRVLAAPSIKRLAELYKELYVARSLAEKVMVGAESRSSAVIGGKLHDIIRLMIISSYVAVCRVIMGVAQSEKL